MALITTHRRRYYAVAKYCYREDRTNPEFARAIARRELPNLLHGVGSALAVGEDFAVDFVDAVNKFLRNFGLNRLAADLSERAINAAGTVGSDTWYLAQSNRGEQLLDAGRITEAGPLFTEILQRLGDAPSYERAVTLGRLGDCSVDGGRPDLAAMHYRVGIAVTEQLEQNYIVKRHRGILYTSFANALCSQGIFSEARVNYELGLKIKEELNDQRGQGVTLGQLGTLAMLEGNLAEARQRYHAALTLFRRLNEPASEAVFQHQFGMAFQRIKEWEQAEQHYREAARLDEQLGNPGGAAQTWNQLALVTANAGKLAAAEGWYRKAIAEMQKLSLDDRGAGCLNNLADLLQRQPGRLAEARCLAEEALAIKQTLDPGAAKIWNTYLILAEIVGQEGQAAAAVAYRRQARAAKRAFAGTLYELRRRLDVIVGALQAIHDPSTRTAFDAVLAKRETNGWTALVNAIRQLLAGERDADALCAPLDLEDAVIVETILAALADPTVLTALLPQEGA